MTYNIDYGSEEINHNGCEDDDIPRQVRLINPAAGFPEHQGKTFIILRRRYQDQCRVQHDQDRKLDHHRHHPMEKKKVI